MVDVVEIAKLRYRMAGILKSRYCMQIRFQVDNVSVQTYMYTYIAQAILQDKIHIAIGGNVPHWVNEIKGPGEREKTIYFPEIDVKAVTIVHECTHAVISTTNKGASVALATHETCAYLAEAVYGLLANDTHTMEFRGLDRPVFSLAQDVVAYNRRNPSGCYVCPHDDLVFIRAVLKNGDPRDFDSTAIMKGIDDGA
jgi:hypothetical protein